MLGCGVVAVGGSHPVVICVWLNLMLASEMNRSWRNGNAVVVVLVLFVVVAGACCTGSACPPLKQHNLHSAGRAPAQPFQPVCVHVCHLDTVATRIRAA